MFKEKNIADIADRIKFKVTKTKWHTDKTKLFSFLFQQHHISVGVGRNVYIKSVKCYFSKFILIKIILILIILFFQSNTASGEVFESKLSDVVKGTAKPVAKEAATPAPSIHPVAGSSNASPVNSTAMHSKPVNSARGMLVLQIEFISF